MSNDTKLEERPVYIVKALDGWLIEFEELRAAEWYCRNCGGEIILGGDFEP